MSAVPRIALTLIQPWATLVTHFGKNIENRRWAPVPGDLVPGGRFWIHAGKKLDLEVYDWACAEVTGFRDAYPSPDDVPLGALLSHVRFDGVVEKSASPWFIGPFGWELADVEFLETPLPCNGAQKLWRLRSDLHADADRAPSADHFDSRATSPAYAPPSDLAPDPSAEALALEQAAHAETRDELERTRDALRAAVETVETFKHSPITASVGLNVSREDARELLELMQRNGEDEAAPRVVHRFIAALNDFTA